MRPALSAAMRRLDLTTAEAVAVVTLAVGAVGALALLWLLSRAPESRAPESRGGVPAPLQVAGTPEGAPSEAPTELVVHVAGRVRRPGLVRVEAGARVADAIAAAGGPQPRAELAALNLARRVVDGEQLLVPDRRSSQSVPAGPASAASPSAVASEALVQLNVADVSQLEQLPGIGPVLAQRIVDHRDSIGGFSSVGELRDVSGIGEKTFQALAPLVTL